KGRVEDALHATRAAVAEGIVAGGGTELMRRMQPGDGLAAKLPHAAVDARAKGRDGGRLGAEIVARALEKPVRTIAENSGVDGAVVADEVRTRGEKNPAIGYNAHTGENTPML